MTSKKMRNYHYVGLFFKLWKGSRGHSFKLWGKGWCGPGVPLLNLRGVRVTNLNFEGVSDLGSQGPEVLGPVVFVPLSHHVDKSNTNFMLQLFYDKNIMFERKKTVSDKPW